MRIMANRYIGGNWCDPEIEEPYDEFDYLEMEIEEPYEEEVEYPQALAEEDEEIKRLIRKGDLDGK